MIRSKLPFRPRASVLALEPRVLFDGAGAIAAVDHLADASAPAERAKEVPAGQTPAAAWGNSHTERWGMEATGPEAAGPTLLLVVDARVADQASLLAGLPANAVLRVVDSGESGLNAVSQALAGLQGIESVQIISHGTPGSFTLGSDTVDAASVAAHGAQLQAWAGHLTADADILLYGCDVGQGAQGQALLTQLAALTGADIAASTNATGAAAKGGDWVLERNTGAIEAGLALSHAAMAGYGELLAATAITDANSATPRVTAEDTPLAITGVSVAGGAGDIITLTVATTGGTAKLSTTAGLTSVTGDDSAFITVEGTVAIVNTALSGLIYKSTADQNSSTSGFAPSIALNVTAGGVGSLTLSNISVTSVNDAPNLSTQANLVVSEDQSGAFSLAQLASSANALDVDITTGQQVIGQQMVIINSLPNNGTLTYLGGAVAIGQVVPVGSLGSLQYTHNGTDIATAITDSFNVTVSDGGGGQTTGAIGITINPANQAPTISGSPTLIEGQVKVVAPNIQLGDAADTLANSTIQITAVSNGGQGTLFFDTNGNGVVDSGEAVDAGRTFTAAEAVDLATKLKFKQDGTEPNAPSDVSKPTYTIKVTDSGGGTATPLSDTQTITIDVLPNNDDPTLTNAHATAGSALDVAEGAAQVIANTELRILDADRNPADISQTTPADQLVYTLTANPQYGEVQLNIGGTAGWGTGPGTGPTPAVGADGWINLGVGGRFTQADVDAGRVRFVQTTAVADGDVLADSFQFTVRDSAFGFDVWTDPANPTTGREGGLRDTPTGAIATQTFHLSITGNNAAHSVYEGDPRPAWPGYGATPDQTLVYAFTPKVTDPGNIKGGTDGAWQEANVVTPPSGSNIITQAMLEYEIVRTAQDSGGTPVATITLPATETVYTLTVQPPNGTVQRLVGGSWQDIPTNGQFTQADINNNSIRFVHDGGEDHVATFGYTVSDGTPNQFNGTFAIDVTPTNDRPTVSGSASAQVTEGNANTVRLGAAQLGMADADLSLDPSKQAGEGAKDFLWFQVTAQPVDGGNAAHGTLERWSGTAWVAVTPGEWLPSTLLTTAADGGTSGLRYVHDGSEPLAYTGGPKVGFSYTVRDDLADPADAFATNSSAVANTSGSNQSNESPPGTVTINIIPVNDAPLVADKPGDADPTIGATITNGGALTGVNEILAGVLEGSTTTITSAYLTAVDRDNTTEQRQYRVTQATSQGTLLLNGAALGVGSTFTQKDVDENKVSYRHSGSEISPTTTDGLGTYNDKFHFVVNDGVLQDSGTGVDNNVFLITLAPANDKPTVTAPTGTITIDSAIAANNPVAGFSVDDPDLANAATSTDFLQVTVRLQSSAGTPVTDYATGFAGGGVQIGYGAGSGVVVTQNGADNILQFQGTKAQVNAALAGLTVTFSNDTNAFYKLEVIVDDRSRDGSGALVTTGNDANGGEWNQSVTPGGSPTAVDGTAYDWKTTVTVPVLSGNIASKTVDLRASSVNQAPTFTGPGSFTVNEDVPSKVGDAGNRFVVSDPESAAFNTPVTVTVTVPQGRLHIDDTGTPGSRTPAGGQAVTIVGQNTGTLTLTGRAADIQAVLNGRDAADSADDSNTGLYYTSVLHANHDQNDVAADDVTLTLNFSEGASAIGGDVGAGSVANVVAPITTAVTITAINDAPTVNRTATAVAIAGNGATAVSGFSITDVDSNDGYAPGENDGVIQVTVRVLDGAGSPLVANDYGDTSGKKLGITLGTSASGHGATVDATLTGVKGALELRGTREQINAYLADLQVTFANLGDSNLDATYKIEVIADDRLRDAATGAFTVPGAPVANGGATNQTGLLGVPATDTLDPYTTPTVTGYNVFNVTSNTRDLFISSINDPGKITASNVTVAEGSATLNLTVANIVLVDSDDNGASTMEVTVTVGAGTITTVGGAGGTVAGLNTSTITITGATEAQINSRLQAITVTFPDVDGAGVATAADWNGTFDVTVVYNDKGNTGTRPADLVGSNDTTLEDTEARTGDGDFMYADGVSNNLVTTRIITVTVTGVNDAPTRTTATVILPAGTEDTDGGVGDTVQNLFGSSAFSDAKDQIGGNGSTANTFAGIAITTNNAIAAQGVWQYSIDGGSTWINLPFVSDTDAFLLDTTAKLRFDPADNFHGTPGGLVTRLVDSSGGAVTSATKADVSGGNSGGTTRYSDSSNSVALNTTVANVNDRPTGTNATLPGTSEDTTNPLGTLVSALNLGYSDATDNQTGITGGGNAQTSLGGIAIVGNSENAASEGVWQYNDNAGGGWIAVGSRTDATALVLPTTASVRFVPVADFNGTPTSQLTVRVADSVQSLGVTSDISAAVALGQTSTWSATLILSTVVNPSNDAPAFSNTVTNPTATEAAGTSSTTNWVKLLGTGTNTVSDIDLTTTPGLVSTVFGQGSVTVSLASGITGDTLRLNTLVAGAASGISAITGGNNGAALVVTFTDAATLAQVQSVLEAIEYQHNGDDPTSIKSGTARSTLGYTIALSDGNNVQAGVGVNAGGPGPLTDSKTGTINLVAVNDPPVAVDDTHEVTEDSGVSSVGNVITGAGSPSTTSDSDPDHTVAQLTVTGIRTGPETGGTPGTVATITTGTTSANGSVVVGQYGTLTIGADGSYSYALDNSNPAVNALNASQTLTEQFTYTLSDPLGATDVAQLTITVKGFNDGGPTIVPVDENGPSTTGQVTVFEAGLTTVADTTETNTGKVTLTANSGLTSISVGGTLVPLATLNSLSTTPLVIDTPQGTLTLTGFTATASIGGVPTLGTLTYSYTLDVAQNTPFLAESTEAIALTILDAAGDTNTGTLTVCIVDDSPTAVADTNSIVRTTASVTGNAFSNDRIGADGAAAPGPITGVKSGSDTSTAATTGVASSVTGTYGAITLAANGSYSYALDTANTTVAALQTGQTLTDTYTYTITDNDGDTSTSTITITITGRSVPVAVNDAFNVNEDGSLSDSLASNDTPSADGGNVWSVTTGPTHGTVTVNSDGTFVYAPTGNYNGPDSFTYTITDGNGDTNTATASITVRPQNDAPTTTHTATNPEVTENAATGAAVSIDPVALLNAGTVADLDLASTPGLSAAIFGAGTVTVTLTDGVAGDVLTVGTLAGIAGTSGGTGSTPLVITLTNTATLAQVDAILAAVRYSNTSDNPTNFGTDTTRSYTVELSDGNNAQADGNAGGPSALQVSVNGTITLVATNDPPVATPNTNTVTEDSGAVVTGNVKTDSTPDSDPDNAMADVPVTAIVATTAGGASTPVADNAGVGTVVTGKYGTLTIKPDGSYSYALDNTNADVNALNDSETLTEVFTYTITDPGALSANSTLTITINGHTDGNPQIVPVDGNAGATGEATVYEKGLTSAGDTSETTTGSLTVTAPDGIASVTIGGTTFTVAQLDLLSSASPSAGINTDEGMLYITGISNKVGASAAPTSATVTYTYTLNARQDHSAAPGTESTDTIALTVTDKSNTPATANGTLTIQIIDDVPTANNDANSITRGSSAVAGNAFTNDRIGADGAAVPGPVTAITGGTLGTPRSGNYGAITLNANGTYSYALNNANPNVAGLLTGQTLTESFQYTITDQDGDTSQAIITITINGLTPNALPVAVNDAFILNEDTSLTSTLTGNDTPSADGGNIWTKTTDPLHGTVVVNPDGTFVYTPNADYNGLESFTYTITDKDGDKSTATVLLTVLPVNDVPVAVNDSATTPKNVPINGNLGGNDKPSGDGGNVWTKTTDPAHGTVVVNANGTYTYTPNNGYTGADSFTYTITDKDGDKSTATVTITVQPPVTPPNDVPVAVNDSASTPKDMPIQGSLTGNDKPSTDGGNVWSKTTDPTHGTVVVNPDGTYTYTPNPGYVGPDSFTYTITDKDGDKSTATVTITVTPPVVVPTNDVPVAVDDTVKTPGGKPISGDLAGNDKPSTDGGNVWSKTTDPANGTVVVNPDGAYTYTPNPGFTGTDSFTYTITDKDGDKSTATVTITVQPPVTPPNDVPVAVNDSASTPKDMPIQGSLTGNDKPSTDGGNVWSKTTDPKNGTVVVNPDGTYTYTPNAGFTGTDSFTYTITDKDGDKSTATVTITVQPPVTPPNDVPVARPDTVQTEVGKPVTGDLGSNDKPSADGGNVWSKTTDPANGTVVVNPDGTYTYTPNPGFTGTDSFTYTITDQSGDQSTATVAVQVVQPTLVDDVRVEGPYFGWDRSEPALRLTIPFDPVEYVGREVTRAQNERELTDPLTFSNPAAVQQRGVQATSLGAALGFDPALFVQHAVRESQARGQLWSDIVEGRLARLSLGSDGRIPTPEWFEPSDAQIVPRMPEQDKPAAEADKPADVRPRPTAGAVPGPVQEAVHSAALRPSPAAAPSFSEQLRSTASRPVAGAARPVSPGSIVS